MAPLNKINTVTSMEDNTTPSSVALMALVNNSSNVLCICNLSGEFEFVNETGLHLFEYNAEDMLNKPFNYFVHPEDLDATTNVLINISAQHDKKNALVNRIKSSTGEYKGLSWIFVSDHKAGKIYATATLTSNIKNSPASATSYQDMGADYVYLSEKLTGIGYWQVELDSRKVTWSEQVFNIHDLPISEEAPSWDKCLALYHEDDREKVRLTLKQAIRENKPFFLQFRLVTPANKLKHIQARGYVEYSANQTPIAIVGTFQDVSLQVSTEEELKYLSHIVKHAGISVLVCDRERRIVWVNEGFEKLTGYTQEEAVGLYPSQMLHGEETSEESKSYMRSRLANNQTVDCDILNYNKKGEKYWIRLSIAPIFDSKNQVTSYLGIQTDITQNKRSTELMRQASHLESLNVMMGGIAHDFNNVLGIARSNLEHLNSKYACANTYQENIDNTFHAIERAADLTQKLLKFSKSRKVEKRPNHIQTCIQETLALLDKSFAKTVDCHIEMINEPIWCNLNKSDFEDCIINLTLNAKEAIEGRGSITISVDRARPVLNCAAGFFPEELPDATYCHIKVKDTGSGIPPENLDKIFTPFYTTKPLGKGTGLGLSMVYHFIRHSNGYIGLDSDKSGTEIHLWLPICEADEPKAPSKPQSQTKDDKTLKILLLDDEQELLKITSILLESDGHNVICCNNAQDALSKLEQDTYDLVLSDILMPGEKQPIDVVREVSENTPETKILLMSGYQGTDNQELSVYPILQKPFSREKLRTSISELFR